MKSNQHKLTIKLSSFILAVLMILFCFPAAAVGTDETEQQNNTTQENTQEVTNITEDEEFFGEEEEFIPWELELEEGDLDLVALKTAELDPRETPAIISAELIEEKGHVNRLYEQEPDVFTIMFQNRDGGKTIYVFSHPVKTISPSGAYTDMTAAEIQAAVNSASASTNATGGASNSLSLTASGSKLQITLGSDFIKSRLGNPDAEKPIMSYNIGEFVIFKAGASTLTNGIRTVTYDVTDEAREWATPGSEVQKFTFTPETGGTQIEADDNVSLGGSVGIITPVQDEEITVMAVTSSAIAGEYAIQSTSDNKYLSYSTSDQLTLYSVIGIPRSKWFFQYLGNSNYKIIPMARQDLCLTYYENELTFLKIDDPESSIWALNLEATNTFSFFIGNYYLSNTLEMLLNVDNSPSKWLLSNANDEELLRSISISNIMMQPGEIISVPTITKNPELTAYTSSNEYFEWVSPDSENIYYDVDNGFCVNETYGVYRIYCRYKFNPEIVSNTAVIIISDDYDITSGAVYLIREYDTDIDENTKLLTMTVGEDSNALSVNSWTSSWFSSKSRYNKEWISTSQAFTITDVGTNLFKISAILSTTQYEVPYNIGSNFPYTGTYTLPDKNAKANTLCAFGDNNIQLSAYSGTAVQKWYIYCVGSQYYFVNSYYTSCQLGYDDSGNISSDNFNWSVTYFGIDVPCIRQTTDYYCGPASALQILYGCNISEIINSDKNIHELQSQLATEVGIDSTKGATFNKITTNILNIKNRFADNAYTHEWNSYTNSLLTTSIEKGYPVIAHVIIGQLPYYRSSTDNNRAGHYVCVFGYDEDTGLVAISDCTCYTQFGIRMITLDELSAACKHGIIYHT